MPVPQNWKIKQFLIWTVQYLKFGKYWYNTFYHRNNFGNKILIVFPVCMKM